MEPTIEEIEAETAAIQEKLRAAKTKKIDKLRAQRARNNRSLSDIQQDQSVKNATGGAEGGARWGNMSATFKHSYSSSEVGAQGPSLIEKIERQMDRRRRIMEDMVVKQGMLQCIASEVYVMNKGRYQAFAAALAILRTSSIREEINRSNERLGYEL